MSRLDEVNVSNDFMFSRVMQDKEICRAVLNKILGVKIKYVTLAQEQKTVKPMIDSKSIRLDVYVEDNMQTIYDVEMQNGNERNLPLRSRYYQSVIDVNILAMGRKYNELRESFVIFICTYDPFSKGRHIYTMTQACKEESTVEFDTKTKVIIVSTKGKCNDVDSEFMQLLEYIENSTDEVAEKSESKLIELMHDRVKEIRSNQEMEDMFMTLEMIRQEEYERGKEEGKEEGREIGEERILKLNKLLMQSDRIEDLHRSIEDKEFREELLKEFNL